MLKFTRPSSGHRSAYSFDVCTNGFTLIELLVVIAIIGLLISILLPSMGRARELARQSVCISNQRSVITAIHAYAVESRGWAPAIADPLPDLPVGSQNFWSTYARRMSVRARGMSGTGNGRPAGLGLLLYGKYIGNLYGSGYCPSQKPNRTHYEFRASRHADKLSSADAFRHYVDTHDSFDIAGGYLYRGSPYHDNTTPAAVDGKTLRVIGEPPAYPYNRFAQLPYRASITSDDFQVRPPKFDNQAIGHHGNAFGVAYSDGSASVVQDPTRKIIESYNITSPRMIYFFQADADDIWDAFDGDRGYQSPHRNKVYGLSP